MAKSPVDVTANGHTHSDQLTMLPMTRSTMRSWRETKTQGLRGGKDRGRQVAEGSSQPVPTLPWVLLTHLDPSGRRGERGERVGELSRYRVKGPTALPDAVCVEHVEDAAEDSRVCNEKAWHCNGMAQRSQGLQRAQHSTAPSKSTLRFLPRDSSSPAKLRKKTKVPCVLRCPRFPPHSHSLPRGCSHPASSGPCNRAVC